MSIDDKELKNYIHNANISIEDVKNMKKISKNIYTEFRKKYDNKYTLFSSHLLQNEKEYKLIIELLKSNHYAKYFLPKSNDTFMEMAVSANVEKQIFFNEIDIQIYDSETLYYKYYAYNSDFFIILRPFSPEERVMKFLIDNSLLFNTAIPFELPKEVFTLKETTHKIVEGKDYELWKNVFKIDKNNVYDGDSFIKLRFPNVQKSTIDEFYNFKGIGIDIFILVFKLSVLEKKFADINIEQQSRMFLYHNDKALFKTKYLINNNNNQDFFNSIIDK